MVFYEIFKLLRNWESRSNGLPLVPILGPFFPTPPPSLLPSLFTPLLILCNHVCRCAVDCGNVALLPLNLSCLFTYGEAEQVYKSLYFLLSSFHLICRRICGCYLNLLSTNNFDHICQEITLLISVPMAAAGLLGPDLVQHQSPVYFALLGRYQTNQ